MNTARASFLFLFVTCFSSISLLAQLADKFPTITEINQKVSYNDPYKQWAMRLATVHTCGFYLPILARVEGRETDGKLQELQRAYIKEESRLSDEREKWKDHPRLQSSESSKYEILAPFFSEGDRQQLEKEVNENVVRNDAELREKSHQEYAAQKDEDYARAEKEFKSKFGTWDYAHLVFLALGVLCFIRYAGYKTRVDKSNPAVIYVNGKQRTIEHYTGKLVDDKSMGFVEKRTSTDSEGRTSTSTTYHSKENFFIRDINNRDYLIALSNSGITVSHDSLLSAAFTGPQKRNKENYFLIYNHNLDRTDFLHYPDDFFPGRVLWTFLFLFCALVTCIFRYYFASDLDHRVEAFTAQQFTFCMVSLAALIVLPAILAARSKADRKLFFNSCMEKMIPLFKQDAKFYKS